MSCSSNKTMAGKPAQPFRMAAIAVAWIASGMLPLAQAVPVTYIIETIDPFDTSIVRNDGVLVAQNAGSLLDFTVNDVLFQGIDAPDLTNFTGTTTNNGYALIYSGIPDLNNYSYNGDAQNAYNFNPTQNAGNTADWGESPDGMGTDSGIMQTVVRTNTGQVAGGSDPDEAITLTATGLAVGTSYRLQVLMDVSDEEREMEVVHNGQGTGNLITGIVDGGKSVQTFFTADASDFSLAIQAWSGWRGVLSAAILSEADAPVPSGDFDGDLDVDGNDFLVWQRDTGANSLADWKAHFGEGPSSLAASFATVPEPTSVVLLSLLLCGIGARRPNHSRLT